jgi:hypothetical protein
MSKRFPIPDFDRDHYKNRPWAPPSPISEDEQKRLIAAAAEGKPGACGAYAVEAPPALCEKFRLRGEHLHLVMCVLPKRKVHLLGRSWAWFIQRGLVIDSLDPATAQVLADWRTPRPMNTRLGPDAGITLPGGVVYAFVGHRYADYWIANRTLTDSDAAAGSQGFSLLSATDDDNNDFHACNLSFTWN